uniref:Uncharacterized protein n=1 Tax=Phaseolus vulgaris TaxID=3885 RepID=V7BVM5_PHAVU|nr:hypothetical protein PHAVU_005G041800g [Phaseolus vulgaris]ESW21100.1 hypothetical protein PHAVU_005G041800g [Phaseolus vulgaris]
MLAMKLGHSSPIEHVFVKSQAQHHFILHSETTLHCINVFIKTNSVRKFSGSAIFLPFLFDFLPVVVALVQMAFFRSVSALSRLRFRVGQQSNLANSVRWLQTPSSSNTDLYSELKELVPEYQVCLQF